MTSQAKKVWAAFTTAFFALVAMLGFTSPATATAGAVAAPAPADLSGRTGRTVGAPTVRTAPGAAEPAPAPAPASARTEARTGARTEARAAAPTPAQVAWWSLPKDRALPPTIKQRIRAEAHGSTPSTRHLPLDLDASSDGAVADAAVGEAVLQPV
ncbi:DUF6344 domain-containing protein [Streptomyces sp. NBC_01387]|uniref:DUF6344 domain-containing protein n=1 Tax=unclassified Streptomyces TaxID=2593676 RepID=UPI0020243FE8|nr:MULTISPECIES: DUF6344 domain-containing protein [unclassified Streptomyces]MCX4549446.1 DUF6344 domain-containing protein [Streptomyces sp. NBC_01500]WSC21000.1 DUF6344 domain-containing protein [Streptomyces sp. NBC_01766]WSV54986.1 DUF6344 domain-containing protein [Streptomyces sp. NBC_01014]